jgi:hypothetical protein
MMEYAYSFGQKYSSANILRDKLKGIKDSIAGGLERILHKEKNRIIMDQKDAPANFSEATETECEVIKTELLHKSYGEKARDFFKRKLPDYGRNLGSKLVDLAKDPRFVFNDAVVIWNGALMGYYHALNYDGIGYLGLIGAFPHLMEIGNKADGNKRTSNLLYYAATLGFGIAAARKIIISQTDGSVNENMFFWPAMADIVLAGYNLLNRAQVYKRITGSIKKRPSK